MLLSVSTFNHNNTTTTTQQHNVSATRPEGMVRSRSHKTQTIVAGMRLGTAVFATADLDWIKCARVRLTLTHAGTCAHTHPLFVLKNTEEHASEWHCIVKDWVFFYSLTVERLQNQIGVFLVKCPKKRFLYVKVLTVTS